MKLAQVSRNYDRASGYYDWLTGLVFQTLLGIETRYRRKTIALLGDIRGKQVLDIGCGTGRNFPLLVSAVEDQGSIIGVDYSGGMLGRAEPLINRRGWRNVGLLRADAADLDIARQRFDAVISTWTLGIVHNFDTALERALAHLEPGGRIAIMDFQRFRPECGPLRWLFPVYRALLQYTGIDGAEDLDDSALRDKWQRGQLFLERQLDDVHFEEYLQGLGFVLAGTTRAETCAHRMGTTFLQKSESARRLSALRRPC